jgi:hypothetical protein
VIREAIGGPRCDEGGAYRCSSVLISAHQCSSVLISAHQCSSVLIRATTQRAHRLELLNSGARRTVPVG